jgi:chorismate mutase
MADEHDIGGKPAPRPALPVAPARPQGQATPSAAAAGPVGGEPQVEDYRRRIDQIDEQLMKLLNARSACAVEIGRIKRRFGLPVYQPEREKWILERVARNNPGPLDSGAVRRVFERVIDESRRLERLAGEENEQKEGV